METYKPDKRYIAPCGMNCQLCKTTVRDKRPCPGCNGDDAAKPAYCQRCTIRHCAAVASHSSGFCYECEMFPCKRLSDLDKRYRTKYHMSMLDNLALIRSKGMDAFLVGQAETWTCQACGGIVGVHRGACFRCSTQKEF